MKMEAEHFIDSPLGPIRIVYTNIGIKSVKFANNEERKSKIEKKCSRNEHLELAIQWFEAYLNKPQETKLVKFPTLDMEAHHSKHFMCKVWNVLKDRVGPGETVSYGELAKLCGNPGGARAVGQAMRNNPYTIIVPCHRVINASGTMGNYSSGVDKKQWLLKHEGREF